MRLLRTLFGYEKDSIPGPAFRVYSLFISLRDRVAPVCRRIDRFRIASGATVVDFGCGPGSYIERASQLVGNAGKVYAVDSQPLAIRSIREKARKKMLTNVVPVLSTGYPLDIDSQSVDVIYALDMFHHVKDTGGFLGELRRMLKPGGTLFIERGHQPLDAARQKIIGSGDWNIVGEEGNLFECGLKEHEKGDRARAEVRGA